VNDQEKENEEDSIGLALKSEDIARCDTCTKLADHAQRAAMHYSGLRMTFVVSNITVATLLVGLYFRFSEQLSSIIVAGAILVLSAAFTVINQKIGAIHMYYNNAGGLFYQQAVRDSGFEEEFHTTYGISKNKAERLSLLNGVSEKIDFYIIWPTLNALVGLVAATLVLTL